MAFDRYMEATALADAYREGGLRPDDVVETLLSAIERHDGKLGAFQAVYADEARMAAEAADKAIRSGHRIGPFHGIPYALKDIVDLEGRITTGGSAALTERISPTTATIALRLRAAGGILIGKTKTVEFAMGGWGTNQRMGTPWNPWDLDTARTPGGSSSGSGVAVAAGFVPCAVGTDTGGSVRIPAAWCGITGLKVTEGLLPTDGIIPLCHSLDTPGPMTRSVRDTVFMYEVMAGRHPSEIERQWQAGEGLFAALDQGVEGLRLGSLNEAEREGIDADILALYDKAVERLRGLGARIEPFEPPQPFDAMKEKLGVIMASESYFHHHVLVENRSAPLDEDVRPRILPGGKISALDYMRALQRRQVDQAAFLQKMSGFAAILLPTAATPAVALPEVDQGGTPARFTRPGNYLAMCGLSVPMGLTGDGLPGGLQVMARGRDEAMAIRIGAAFEAAGPGIGHPAL